MSDPNIRKSKDSLKLNKFNTFQITESKFLDSQAKGKKLIFKHFRNAFILGAITEFIIINTRIYDNIIQKSTTRRLEAKKKEDDNLAERKQLMLQKNTQNSQQVAQ
ncbi:hypothetical protein TTHERM_00355770 (macronuclear) [Tetrahymena thermophila SB210]|uniref:Uncharacterized protein n=1 Tax=Tetrahymena thermophila (strain SB210) TaxID=312017 RepID=Q22XZ4_TETTS|nr:hypothetical protein TTHERM_00355770 [Tetrahymena thermophila SB210]EAR90230.2 hypothetical protein TTHERM_00355770 [Tetrahymena thermophila SB210]|eukprot:XP_001010475.2 hypothetical protein TTHERM_00355770 [Tetrahymena thermophila SB210]